MDTENLNYTDITCPLCDRKTKVIDNSIFFTTNDGKITLEHKNVYICYNCQDTLTDCDYFTFIVSDGEKKEVHSRD